VPGRDELCATCKVLGPHKVLPAGPGTYNVTWRVRMLPEWHQPDGNYNLDPVLVAAPML